MPVVYIAAEGVGGLSKWNAAIIQRTGWDGANVYFITVPPDLMNDDDVRELIALLRAYSPGLVAIDTLARSNSGDENSAQDSGKVISAIDRIRAELGCAVLVAHHPNKSDDRVERGSGAYRGAAQSTPSLLKLASLYF